VLTADKLNRTSEASQHPVLAVSGSTERSKYLGQLLLRSRHDFRDRTAPLKPGLAVSTLCNRHECAVREIACRSTKAGRSNDRNAA
jgi:hypothetical protein